MLPSGDPWVRGYLPGGVLQGLPAKASSNSALPPCRRGACLRLLAQGLVLAGSPFHLVGNFHFQAGVWEV